jgi:hypothetical protein
MPCQNWQATARGAADTALLPPSPNPPPQVAHPVPPDVPPAVFAPLPTILRPNSPSLAVEIGNQLEAHLTAITHAHPASAIDMDTSGFTGILEAANSIIYTAQAVAAELDQHQHLSTGPLDGGLF